MNEDSRDDVNADKAQPPNNPAPNNPRWWTDSIETSWRRARAEAIADWNRTIEAEQNIQHRLIESALAFGHGAREQYMHLGVWASELEDRLRADWKETGHEAEVAWESVRAAVQHAWERAAKTRDALKAARR